MKFGEIRVADAAGAILAHSQRIGGRTLKKGLPLSADDIADYYIANHYDEAVTHAAQFNK